MKTYFNWIVVKDKKQYLWLLALPLGLLKAILFDIHDPQMFNRLFETVMVVMFVFISSFVLILIHNSIIQIILNQMM